MLHVIYVYLFKKLRNLIPKVELRSVLMFCWGPLTADRLLFKISVPGLGLGNVRHIENRLHSKGGNVLPQFWNLMSGRVASSGTEEEPQERGKRNFRRPAVCGHSRPLTRRHLHPRVAWILVRQKKLEIYHIYSVSSIILSIITYLWCVYRILM